MGLKLFIPILVFLSTLLGIRYYIKWSLGRRILDIPNERSSHTTPVPVGSGVVIAFSVLAAVAAGYFAGMPFGEGITSGASLGAYFVGALMIVIVSWFDDVRKVPVAIRFLVHACAALILLAASGAWRGVLPGPAPLGLAISFLWIIGLTNAYNFMDGIDGIAGIQAVVAGLGWAAAGAFAGSDFITLIGLSITASCAAYLTFNWQPAKVFMGDSGSAFLGFTLGALPVLLVQTDVTGSVGRVSDTDHTFITLALWAVAFVWPFVFDSSFTFIRRVLSRERVWKAHRSHLYQQMVKDGFSHASVSRIYGILAAACGVTALVSDNFYLTIFLALATSGIVLLICSRPRSGHA